MRWEVGTGTRLGCLEPWLMRGEAHRAPAPSSPHPALLLRGCLPPAAPPVPGGTSSALWNPWATPRTRALGRQPPGASHSLLCGPHLSTPRLACGQWGPGEGTCCPLRQGCRLLPVFALGKPAVLPMERATVGQRPPANSNDSGFRHGSLYRTLTMTSPVPAPQHGHLGFCAQRL